MSTIYNEISNFDKNILLVGSSFSLDLNFIKQFNGTLIGIGDAPYRLKKKVNFDYWINANTVFPQPANKKHLKYISNINSKVFIATSAFSEITKSSIDEVLGKISKDSKLRNKIYFYDGHEKKSKCSNEYGCCYASHLLDLDSNLLDYFRKKYKLNETNLLYRHSVADIAFVMCLLSKPKNIFITGVDLPIKEIDYAHYGSLINEIFFSTLIPIRYRRHELYIRLRRLLNHDICDPSVFSGKANLEIITTWKTLFKVANLQGTRVHITNPKSILSTLNY